VGVGGVAHGQASAATVYDRPLVTTPDCSVTAAVSGQYTVCPSRPADRRHHPDQPDGEPGLNHPCVGYNAFFHHIDRPTRMMAGPPRQGRASALIMRRYADTDADAHRPQNAPCPCGGGRKWAHCHGTPVATNTASRPGGR
jgi:hypothetical protein